MSDNKNYGRGRTSELLSYISSAEEKIFSNVIRSGCFLSICFARRMYLPGAVQMLFTYLNGGHSLETICVSLFKHENNGKGIV